MPVLADIGTKVGGEIKNLGIRMSAAETAIVNLGGQTPPPTGNFTIEPVTWTNLSEINLSGEKLTNENFSQSSYVQNSSYAFPTSPNNGHVNDHTFAVEDRPLVVALQTTDGLTEGEIYRVHVYNVNSGNARICELDGTTVGWMIGRGTKWEVVENLPTSWSVNSGTLDQAKLSEGIIKGSNGAVGIDQVFSSPLAIGTRIVVKATRADFGTGGVAFKHLKANGNAQGGDIHIPISDGFVEYEVVTSEMHGIRLSTQNGTHEISSVSVFQGVVSGGSVQTFTGGSIEKISGSVGYNAGASSVQKIDGQKDGYVQFQIGSATQSVRVGLVNQDSDYEVDIPFKLHFGNGNIDCYQPFLDNQETYENGDWFRIRHYSTSNEIKFQKREDVYHSDATLRSSTYAVSDDSDVGLYVVFLKTDVGQQTSGTDVEVTLNRGYEIVGYSSASNSLKILDDNGNNAWLALNNTSSDRNRGDAWEFATLAGQDYFTFYTHPVLSNGDDLYVDTSFHTVGARLNDVQIAYK